MTLATLLLAGLLVQAAHDTVPAPPGDAYQDPGAAEMVRRARARTGTANREILGYRTVARQRLSAGLRAFGRERLLYRAEAAARVEWRRGAPARVEVLGAREVAPVAYRDAQGFSDRELRRAAPTAVFDPDREWHLRIPTEPEDESEPPHPLAPGAEAHYRYRSGDPTALRLPDGRTVRLLELVVTPRRDGPLLLSGSLWLEAETHAPVRAVFRFSTPMAVGVSGGALEWGFSGTVDLFTVEYGLWEGRWWLPRLMAVDGYARIGGISVPLRLETAYDAFEVLAAAPAGGDAGSAGAGWGDAPPTEGLEALADSAVRRCRPQRRAGDGSCPRVEVWVPSDRERLVESEHLPESIYARGEELLDEGALQEAMRALGGPGAGQRPSFRWRVLDPSLLRYNRVEGATVGTSARAGLGTLEAGASAWVGLADGEVGFQAEVGRAVRAGRQRLAVYRRLDAVSPADRPFGPGNSLSALLFGDDDGDYYRAEGVEAGGSAPGPEGVSYDWRAYAERQRPVETATDFSLRGELDGSKFRPNPPADAADQLGAAGALRVSRGLDPTGWRATAALEATAEVGDFGFLRPGASLFLGVPLPGPLAGALELAAGTTLGDAPAQRAWRLGGASTVRGISPAERRPGAAYWRGRAETATAFPGARVVGFGDFGWVGPRAEATLEPALVSAGVGASVLDGLLRLDLARALRGGSGWRLELYLGGAL